MAHPALRVGEALGATRAAFTRSFARPDLLAWLVANLLAERERWLLWLPVGLGAGIAIYFALPLEPPLWLGASGLLLAALLLAWSRWRLPAEAFQSCAPGLLGLVVFLLGFTVASWRTYLVEAPVLDRRAASRADPGAHRRVRIRPTPRTVRPDRPADRGPGRRGALHGHPDHRRLPARDRQPGQGLPGVSRPGGRLARNAVVPAF